MLNNPRFINIELNKQGKIIKNKEKTRLYFYSYEFCFSLDVLFFLKLYYFNFLNFK